MKRIIFLLLLFCSNSAILSEGFAAGTLVKTPFGYKTIEQLNQGDYVTCFNCTKKAIQKNKVLARYQDNINTIIRIFSGTETIDVAPDQKFFVPETLRQVSAQTIANSQRLKELFIHEHLFDAISTVETETTLYKLVIEHNHNFYVSKQNMLVHNFFPVIALGLSISASGIQVLSGVTISALAGSILCWAMRQSRDKNRVFQDFSGGFIDNPDLDPNNNDENKRQKNDDSIKNRRKSASKSAKEMKFKATKDYKFNSHGEKVYQKGDILISLDRDSHNGGFWKMFTRDGCRKGTFDKTLKIKICD